MYEKLAKIGADPPEAVKSGLGACKARMISTLVSVKRSHSTLHLSDRV